MIKKQIVKQNTVKEIVEQAVQQPVVKALPPIAKFRSGVVECSVWEREIVKEDNTTFLDYTFTMQRSYKDSSDEWKHTNSMRKKDAGNCLILMQKVAEFLLLDEDEETEDQ